MVYLVCIVVTIREKCTAILISTTTAFQCSPFVGFKKFTNRNVYVYVCTQECVRTHAFVCVRACVCTVGIGCLKYRNGTGSRISMLLYQSIKFVLGRKPHVFSAELYNYIRL